MIKLLMISVIMYNVQAGQFEPIEFPSLSNNCDAASCVTLDLSSIKDQTKQLYSPDTSKTISYTLDPSCNTNKCDGDVSLSVSTQTDLISQQSQYPQTINFKSTSNRGDAQAYTVTVTVKFVEYKTNFWGRTPQSSSYTSETVTFTYVDPYVEQCKNATITWPAPPDLTTSVLKYASVAVEKPQDSVSAQYSTPANSDELCGQFTDSYTVVSAPDTFVNATMYDHFYINIYSSPSLKFFAEPRSNQEVGTYILRHKIHLKDFPTQSIEKVSTVEITLCVVESLQIVQKYNSSPGGTQNLHNQFYTLYASSPFNYQLDTKQTPACGYDSSDWTIESGTILSGTQSQYFTSSTNIDANTGLYSVSISDLGASDRAGKYTVQIASVTVNGTVWTKASSTSQLTGQSSFVMTISTGCYSTTITASTPQDIVLTVFDATAYYPSTGAAFSEFTDKVSTSAGHSDLCPKTYTATIQADTGSAQPSTFSLDTLTKTFQIYSGEYNQKGTYNVTLVGSLIEHNNITKSTSFKVTIRDPCWDTTLLQPSTALNDMTTSVKVASGAVTQQVGTVKDQLSIVHSTSTPVISFCGNRSYSIRSSQILANTDLSATEVQISSSGLISIQTTNSATVGNHLVELEVKLTNYPNVTLQLDSFQVTILPCAVTSVQVVNCLDSANLIPQTYTLSASATLSYCLSAKQTPACEYPASGWEMSATGPAPTNFQTIDASGTYRISSTTDTSQAGSYTVAVKAVTINSITYGSSYTALENPSSFSLTVVNPCAYSDVTASSVQNITLSVWDSEASYPLSGEAFTEFTDSVSQQNAIPTMCAKSYSATITNSQGKKLSVFTLNSSTRQFQISSQEYAQIGTYQVTLTGSLVDFPTRSASKSFYVIVKDPCLKTQWILPSAPSDMQTSVLVQDSGGNPYYKTQQVGVMQDQMSKQFGDATGTQYCGERSYQISSVVGTAKKALNLTELQIESTSGKISVYTADSSKIGTHTVTVTITVKNYSVSKTLTPFKIEIFSCIVTDFKMFTLSPTYDMVYGISDRTKYMTLESVITSQVPPCGYQEVLAFIDKPAFVAEVQQKPFKYSVHTRQKEDIGTYNVAIISTISNYNISPAPTCYQTIKLDLIDPCPQTKITTIHLAIENFVSFAGFTVSSNLKYVFNDTESIDRTIPSDSFDFCGEKVLNFKLNSTETQMITAENQDYIFFSPSQGSSYGVSDVELQAHMKDIESIKSISFHFNATTLQYIPPKISDVTYTIGQEAQEFFFQPFKLLPENFQIGNSDVRAYILTQSGQLNKKFIDFSCNCLTQTDDKPWIVLNQTENKLIISSSDDSQAGEYIIALVQSFESLPDQHPFTTFRLTLKKQLHNVTLINAPKFESPLPTSIQLKQCGNQTYQPWTFQVPPAIDPNESPVSVKVVLDEKIFHFDIASQTINQISIMNESANKTIKFVLSNELNLTSTFTMQVRFTCEEQKLVNTTQNFVPPELKITLPKQLVQKPAEIISISRSGVLEIKFYKPLYVPIFSNSTLNNTARILAYKQVNQTLDQYINKEILSVKLKAKNNITDVDWYCQAFNKDTLTIQLLFSDPMEVSQTHRDELIVQFIETDRFVLSSESEYLFSMNSTKTVSFYVPTQLPSKQTAQLFQSISDSVQQVGVTVIVVTLLLQIVAKKVITSMWLYYAALQLELLIVQHSNMLPPSSVDVVINSVSGIINLSSLDKKQIAQKLHIDVLLKSEVFQALDGVALVSIGIILLVLMCGIAIYTTKQSPRVQKIFIKIRDVIFWNFLIRYFQASFIGFNFAALSNVKKTTSSLSDIVTSTIILVCQYGVIGLFTYIILTRDLWELDLPAFRQKIGNLYLHLSTKKRRKVMFGIMFFVQRILIVILLAFRYNFSIQWQLCQFVIMLNTIYLFTTVPYSDPSSGILDSVNCILLLVTCVLTAAYSAWNTDTNERFIYGIVFDSLMGVQFILNAFFIITQVATKSILKIKQMRYRCKVRRDRKARLAAKKQDLIEISDRSMPGSVVSRSEAKEKTRTSSLKTTDIEESHQRKELRLKSNMDSQLEMERSKILIELDKISEISEISLTSSDSEAEESAQRAPRLENHKKLSASSQEESKDQRTNQAQSSVSQSQKVQPHNFVRSQEKQSSIPPKHTSQKKVLEEQDYSAKAQLARFMEKKLAMQQQRDNQQNIQQRQEATQVGLLGQEDHSTTLDRARGQVNQVSQFSNDDYSAKAQLARFEQNKLAKKQQQNNQVEIQQRQAHFQSVNQQDSYMNSQLALQYQYQPTSERPSQFVQVKTKSPSIFASKSPKVGLAAQQKANQQEKGPTLEQICFENEIKLYYSGVNNGVRTYPPGQVFDPQTDIWPYYKQALNPDNQEPRIDQEEHRVQVANYLRRSWIESFPEMPYLPLFVGKQQYTKICKEIEPEVKATVELRNKQGPITKRRQRN